MSKYEHAFYLCIIVGGFFPWVILLNHRTQANASNLSLLDSNVSNTYERLHHITSDIYEDLSGVEVAISENFDSISKNSERLNIVAASIDPKNFRWSKIKQVRRAVQETIDIFGYNKYMTTEQITAYSSAVVDWCDMYDVPISLVLAVTRRESAFNPKAVSKAKAMGLMQMIPATAEDVASKVSQVHYSMFKIKDSVRFGVYYLMTLLDRYDRNIEMSLQAYNCGPTCVSRVHSGEWTNFPHETREYVRVILSECLKTNEESCEMKGFLKYYQDKGL